MLPSEKENIISNIELILPQKVIERCYTLENGTSAEFNSVNSHLGTSSKIKIWRKNVESVTINLIGKSNSEIDLYSYYYLLSLSISHTRK